MSLYNYTDTKLDLFLLKVEDLYNKLADPITNLINIENIIIILQFMQDEIANTDDDYVYEKITEKDAVECIKQLDFENKGLEALNKEEIIEYARGYYSVLSYI